jgi:hypothetical protein
MRAPFVENTKRRKNSMAVKMRSIAIAAAVISGVAASQNLVASWGMPGRS